ncbi:hypothetical protein YC2023_066666 [Brassica napus]|uniref:Uncharacterized protein n=1 Tax=Brassica campestris TaxID=3711 RepID=M4D137_BRACM
MLKSLKGFSFLTLGQGLWTISGGGGALELLGRSKRLSLSVDPTQKSPNSLALEGGEYSKLLDNCWGNKYSGIEFLQIPGKTPSRRHPSLALEGEEYSKLRDNGGGCAERATRSYSKKSRAPKSLKEKLDEHSKQLEQSAKKLSQLESKNLNLRGENQALNTASNKKRRFRTRIRPMPTLETPNSRTCTTIPPTTSQGDAETREKAKGSQTYDVEDSESELEHDKEAPEGAAKTESPMVAYLSRCSPRGSTPCSSWLKGSEG